MKKKKNGLLRTFKYICLAGVFALGLMTIISTGGGGGGDDSVISDDPAPPMPSRVKYIAGGPCGDPSTTGITLVVDGTMTIDTTFYLEGTYTKATQVYSLTLSPVPRIAMRVTGAGFVLPITDGADGFGLRVDESLQWQVRDHPNTGEFIVGGGNFIRVTVNPDAGGAGIPGVDVALVEFGMITESASLSWADFIATLNNGAAPTYQRQAALAYLVLQRLYHPLHGVMQNLNTIAEQESALEAAGSGVTLAVPLCDELNGDTGTFSLTWYDGPGEIPNALGPGDNISIDVDNCWLDDPDLLYASGQLLFDNYGETTTPFRIGIEEVILTDLLLTETEGDAGSVIPGSSILYNTFSSVQDRDGLLFELYPDVSGNINLVNLVQIAEATATAITLPSEVGNFAVSLLEEVTAISGTSSCEVSGTYDYLLSVYPFENGATMNVTFNNCVRGSVADPVTINGSYTLTATRFTSIEDLGFDLVLDDVSTTDDVGTSVISGQMHFDRVLTGGTTWNEVSSSVSGQSLNVAEGGVIASLSDFSISGARTASSLTLGDTGETFSLQLSTLGDALAGEIVTTFSGSEMVDLDAGSVRVQAVDHSKLLLTITAADGSVNLDLDSDGDGAYEDRVATNWDELY
jgi:hypothetical protein